LGLAFTGGLTAGFFTAGLAATFAAGFDLLAAATFFFAIGALLATGLLACFLVLAGFFAGMTNASF
jgi:hypothetical protein